MDIWDRLQDKRYFTENEHVSLDHSNAAFVVTKFVTSKSSKQGPHYHQFGFNIFVSVEQILVVQLVRDKKRKKNKKELNSLADEDNWEAIYQHLFTEFDTEPESKKAKELRQTFDFIF